MKMFRYIVFLTMAFAAASCMKPFDLKLDDEPIIYLEAFPGVEDVVVFNIQPGYAYSNTALKPEFKPEIHFTVNGEDIPVVLNEGSRFGDRFPETSYVADYKPVPGDRMTVEVHSEGFSSIYAQTSIPQPFPERKIDYRVVQTAERDYNVIFVSFKDDADIPLAYGMQIHEETTYYKPDVEPETYYYLYAGDQIADDYEFAPQSFEGITMNFNGWSVQRGDYIAGWDDELFAGQDKTISMVVNSYGPADSFFEHTFDNPLYDESGEVIGNCPGISHNKLLLYTMSPEFYKYAVAQELILDNADFFAGIAPSNFCYSNIKGGYGAFAGIYRVETDWITREFIENNR
ncbi:MAG: DUF4249 family protein [Bacteroidales bacterium]|nr:DUF4249 family protein [Bacteroidales bacterium]